jgi:hypothetical protein
VGLGVAVVVGVGGTGGEWGPLPEPLLAVHALRVSQSGLLGVSVGASLCDRLGVMRTCVGEAHYMHLCGVAQLDV